MLKHTYPIHVSTIIFSEWFPVSVEKFTQVDQVKKTMLSRNEKKEENVLEH